MLLQLTRNEQKPIYSQLLTLQLSSSAFSITYLDYITHSGEQYEKAERSIVFEVVTEKYTKGLRKKIVESKMNRLGTKAGSSYDFGIRGAKDIESYGENIRVVEEWSYFEDEEVEPRVMRLLRSIKLFSRGQ